jgi:hypothetical protein
MSHYIERYCPEHGYYQADDGGDQECDECRAQGKLPYQIADKRISYLERESAALRAEVERYRLERKGEDIWLHINDGSFKASFNLGHRETGSFFQRGLEACSDKDAARRGVESEHELQNAFEDAVTRAERAETAIVKLVGAIDMIRETIHGGNVQDLLLIINNALDEAKNV